jgi:short-subunit dehydrogenase
VITSVAGDRGRASNYVYGSAKGGLSRFLQGVRHRLAGQKNIHIVDIRPGFVDTPMTAHIAKKGILFASPERVAKGMVKAMARGQHVIYLPWFWRWILLVVKLTPNFIFHKTKF